MGEGVVLGASPAYVRDDGHQPGRSPVIAPSPLAAPPGSIHLEWQRSFFSRSEATLAGSSLAAAAAAAATLSASALATATAATMGSRKVKPYLAADSEGGEALDRLGLLDDCARAHLLSSLADVGLTLKTIEVAPLTEVVVPGALGSSSSSSSSSGGGDGASSGRSVLSLQGGSRGEDGAAAGAGGARSAAGSSEGGNQASDPAIYRRFFTAASGMSGVPSPRAISDDTAAAAAAVESLTYPGDIGSNVASGPWWRQRCGCRQQQQWGAWCHWWCWAPCSSSSSSSGCNPGLQPAQQHWRWGR